MKVQLIGTSALVVGALFVVPQEQDLAERIESIATAALDGDLGGLSIVIDVGSETFSAEGWGYADAGRSELAEAGSSYRAGALTGVFLSVATLQLADRDVLALDDSVTKYLPDLPYEEEDLTIEHLLTHTSGIPSYADLLAGEAAIDPARIQEWLAEMALESAPGECQRYSNTNVLLLGWIVAQTSGKTVQQYLTENVFRAAGMEDTLYCFDERHALRESASITNEFAGATEDETGVPQPFDAIGLCTTAVDLVRFQRALVDRSIVSEDAFEKLITPIALSDGDYAYFGHGMNHTPLDDLACASYGGSMSGGSVHVAFYPDLELTIAVAASGDEAPLRSLERSIARLFFQLPEPGVHDLALEPEELRVFLGAYYVGCNEYVIHEADGRLAMKTPFGRDHVLLYQGMNLFLVSEDPEIRLTFEIEDSTMVAFVLEEHGATSRAKRLR
jgi:D-alanyl-D-alanine carboxypeptidase